MSQCHTMSHIKGVRYERNKQQVASRAGCVDFTSSLLSYRVVDPSFLLIDHSLYWFSPFSNLTEYICAQEVTKILPLLPLCTQNFFEFFLALVVGQIEWTIQQCMNSEHHQLNVFMTERQLKTVPLGFMLYVLWRDMSSCMGSRITQSCKK